MMSKLCAIAVLCTSVAYAMNVDLEDLAEDEEVITEDLAAKAMKALNKRHGYLAKRPLCDVTDKFNKFVDRIREMYEICESEQFVAEDDERDAQCQKDDFYDYMINNAVDALEKTQKIFEEEKRKRKEQKRQRQLKKIAAIEEEQRQLDLAAREEEQRRLAARETEQRPAAKAALRPPAPPAEALAQGRGIDALQTAAAFWKDGNRKQAEAAIRAAETSVQTAIATMKRIKRINAIKTILTSFQGTEFFGRVKACLKENDIKAIW